MKAYHFFSLLFIGFASFSQSTTPKKLLIYYGIPSLINGTNNLDTAAKEFAKYDYVVWGDSLDLTSKQGVYKAEAQTVMNKARALKSQIEFFGYLYLGNLVAGEYVTDNQIPIRIDSIAAFGYDGVLFDECGYDGGSSRLRLINAVNKAKQDSLVVIGNTQTPEDILFSDYNATYNPQSLETPFDPEVDYYFYESHLLKFNSYYTAGDYNYWFANKSPDIKVKKANGNTYDIRILSVTTDTLNIFDEGKFYHAWYGAWLMGHEATGWGEYYYSANGIAPFRTRPTISNPGTSFASTIPTRTGDMKYYFR